MTYHVKFGKTTFKALSKLDKFTSKMLINWISEKLDGCENPRLYGKPPSSNMAGLWRYRIGDYRIISKIEDKEVIILKLTIGHRRDIYDK